MPNIMAMRWGKLYKGTPAELALEEAVAALGYPYRTQFPGYLYGFRFFPDFLFPTLKLIIEVDDDSHNRAEKIEADRERTEALNRLGYTVVRCTNENALADPYGTVRALLKEAGIGPDFDGYGTVSDCLPKPGKASRQTRQAAKSADRRQRRGQPPRDAAEPTKTPKP